MTKLKTYIMMVADKFPEHHSRKGQLTNFEHSIQNHTKLHTIRQNYQFWKPRIDKVNQGKGILSVRKWEGAPRKSPQIELFQFNQDSGIDIDYINKVRKPSDLNSLKHTHIELFRHKSSKPSIWVSIEEIAMNDGLSLPDFESWFYNIDPFENLALIYYSPFRYN